MTTAPTSPACVEPVRLRRDRLTLSLYGYFVVWGWFLYSFNPAVPLLGRELGISKAQAGLHGTALAVGAVLAALATPRLLPRFGRRTTLVAAGLLIALGTVVLVTGPGFAWTLSGVLVMALGANVAISAGQAGLVLHHRGTSSAAVTEANGVGSSVGLLGPLAVGACVAAGWGWRPAVAVTGLLAVATAVVVGFLPRRGVMAHPAEGAAPATDADPAATAGATASATPADGLPGGAGRAVAGDARAQATPDRDAVRAAQPGAARASWCYLVAVVATLAVENATTFWSADLITQQTGAHAGIATAATAGLVAGMSVIRFVVGPLSLRIEPATLLACSFLLAIVGWAVLWTATDPAVALTGLVIAGFGYGAQYPLSIALLLSTAGGAADRAQSRATFAGGAAIGVAPFALGALADAFGAHSAFVLVPVMALVGAFAAFAGPRVARRPGRAAAVPDAG
ncbi:MFS transporter [Cellulomonas cellasea]|uniref:MFS family permease n=1 Tax=Cellulomonas cellasea TaxID=43670 RepID=A0A7W4UDF3_9CELL|nr:MFS transporter [Cellulomonas cellasea]MBB2922152.1 MFS family permease [Cellulomonas cellasea]